VTVGNEVKAGELLAILESMKMEIPLYATETGVVTDFLLNDASRVNAVQAAFVLDGVDK
jgi:urea carboxylase